MHTAILVLAAGSSSRMGQSKQLLNIDGESLLRNTVNTALAVSSDTTVVLGARYGEHKKIILDLPADVVENKEWEKGIGRSLKVGLTGMLKKNNPVDGVIVIVCDQPNLTGTHLGNLIAAAERTHVHAVASSYAGTIGVPALFKKVVFDLLLGIDDEAGAKKVIQHLHEAVVAIDFPGGETDLDTPDEYKAFLAGR